MSLKDQAVGKCKQVWNFLESNTKKLFHSVAGAHKTKEFYQNHKEVCIGVGIAIVALFIIRRRYKKNKNKTPKQQTSKQKEVKAEQCENKEDKKKSQVVVPPTTSKKFMDQDDVQFFPDQPSTDIIRKDKNQKKKHRNQNSSSQDQRQDRIFFQMYNTYRKTQESQ